MLKGLRRKRNIDEGVERGQALVEAALVIVILLLLLSAIVDLGRAFFVYLALHNAAGEGAYYGSAFPTNHAAYGTFANPDNIEYRVRNESSDPLVNWSSTTVTISYAPALTTPPPSGEPSIGDIIIVDVAYPFDLIGPLPGLLGFPNTITLRASARQTVLAGDTSSGPAPTAAATFTAPAATSVAATPTTGAGSTPSATSAAATPTVAPMIHASVVNGSSSSAPGRWAADAEIEVHNDAHQAVNGATVSFEWRLPNYPNEPPISGSCTTNASGRCPFGQVRLDNLQNSVQSVTMVINSASFSGSSFNSSASHGLSRQFNRP